MGPTGSRICGKSGPWRLSAVGSVVVAALVGASTAGAARNLCTAAQPIVKGVLGVPNTPLKEYHHQAGIFLLCQYGPSEGGAAITENPNVTAAAFKAKQHSMGGVATSGVGVPAFLVPGSFPTLYFLKGTTELSVGAKVSSGRLRSAARAILRIA